MIEGDGSRSQPGHCTLSKHSGVINPTRLGLKTSAVGGERKVTLRRVSGTGSQGCSGAASR